MKSSKERLIVALDFSNIEEAQDLVNKLDNEVIFYKIGLELAMTPDYFRLINWLSKKNKKIFADLKLLDIGNTVGKAVKNLSKYKNINFLTIHAASKDIMSKASMNKSHIKILAVTILTNLNKSDLIDMNFDSSLSIANIATKRSALAKSCNIDGVISSGLEASNIRNEVGDDFMIVTPAIRPDFLINNESDDQKRAVDVQTAFKNGADYIVVGRPITQNLEPRFVASRIQQQIKDFFETS